MVRLVERRGRLAISLAALACFAIVAGSRAVEAAKFTDIYVFQGGADGQSPSGGLVADVQGRLYGSTSQGGVYGYGTVYRLTPPVAGQTQWTEEILHSFSLSDGASPSGTLVMDTSGNLYGTSPNAGPSDPKDGYGTVFKLSNAPGWPLTILHDFGDGSDGGNPGSGVVFGPNGLLYGITGCFGTAKAGQCGTLFSVSPNGDTTEFAVLHVFGKSNYGANGDGFEPTAVRVIGGTTLIGGCFQSYAPTQYGDIYQQKITADGSDPYQIDYFFKSTPDVSGPLMPPLPGTGEVKGIYFGVAQGGGAYTHGGIYTLSPSRSGGGSESVIYSFGSQPDDGSPTGPESVIQTNSSGVLEGTTYQGGHYGQGTLYELDPPAEAGESWTETILVNFNSEVQSVGGSPQGTLLQLGKAIYGAVEYTKTGYGAIYEERP